MASSWLAPERGKDGAQVSTEPLSILRRCPPGGSVAEGETDGLELVL
jgi:hypothetical protein